MDIATVVGLIASLVFLIGAALIEGNFEVAVVLEGLLKPTAAMIVFGGTFGAVLVSFPLSTFMKIPKLFGKAFMHKEIANPAELVELFVRLAEKARREGLLSLEEDTSGVGDKFVRKGIMLVVDGQDPELVRSILETEIEEMEKRHKESYDLFAAAGGYAPTMGIVGTVMGLIEVLRNLSEPSELGAKVAVAFVATLYGIFSANVLWLPISAKLKARSNEESGLRTMMLEGILAVQAGENPRIIKEKLESYMPPSMRRSEEAEVQEAQPTEPVTA